MTRRRQLAILGVALVPAIVAPGVFFIGMRAGVQARPVKQGSVYPVLSIPRARFGGIVCAVLAKTGERVEAGQVLVRFETKELETRLMQLRKAAQAADAAVKGGNAMAQIPHQMRQYLYEVHPNTVQAEREYIDALAALEQAQGADRAAADLRLRHASEQRTLVRRRLGETFAGSANGEDSRVYLAEIARNIAEVEKLLQDAEVRAPSNAVVDLLDARAGEKVQPGQPVAVLVSVGEYAVDLAVTESELRRLHTGMALKGRLQGSRRQIESRIESISTRKLPVIARDNLRTAEEPVVRVRIVSAAPLLAGAIAAFELP
jgi:multidrug resistance efflux pump